MLSVIIIAKNEAMNLRRCLSSVSWADEIIILDSGSTDNTLAIAKEFTDKVYSTDWPGYGIQKQRALTYATGDWILNLDADEVVTEALRHELLKAMQEDKADAYHSPIHLNFYGQSLSYSWSPKHHIRFFKRLGAHYTENIVHESIALPSHSRIGKLKNAIQHYCLQDVSHALQKMNLYSSYSAAIRKEQRPAPSMLKVTLSACWMFFRCYFIQRGWIEGKKGFLLAVLSAQGSFYRGIKMIYPDKESPI